MPSFTMELWRVLDLKPDGIDEDEWLGLKEYTLHEGVDRDALNKKIKEHFMYQEIAHETISQFRFSLKRKMNEIMPVYNELYRSVDALIASDPLMTINMKTLSTGVQDQTATGSSTADSDSDVKSNSENVTNEYPQTGVSVGGKYATSGAAAASTTNTKGNVKENSESENKTNTETESSTTGYQGVPAQLIATYRAAIINVDMMIINELDSLFMMIWNNSDTYSQDKGYYYGF